MQVLTPDRTDSQRAQQLDALRVANQVRSYRAGLKRDIAAGRKDALRILVDPPEKVWTMRVMDLLRAMPQVGRVKAHRALKECRISPSRTVAEITRRQRLLLADWLRW